MYAYLRVHADGQVHDGTGGANGAEFNDRQHLEAA